MLAAVAAAESEVLTEEVLIQQGFLFGDVVQASETDEECDCPEMELMRELGKRYVAVGSASHEYRQYYLAVCRECYKTREIFKVLKKEDHDFKEQDLGHMDGTPYHREQKSCRDCGFVAPSEFKLCDDENCSMYGVYSVCVGEVI